MLLEIAFTLCRIAAPQDCEERRHRFMPRIPVACIFAAGPELARVTPKGFSVATWRCVDADAAGGQQALGGRNAEPATAR